MSAKVGHADLGENQVEGVTDAVKQEGDTSEIKEDVAKDVAKGFISKETMKKGFKVSKKVGKKVGKGALKLVDKVDESGLAEQAGCMAAIPGGEILCCICKLFIGARKAHKAHKQLKKMKKGDVEGAAGGIEDAADAVGNVTEVIGGD